MVVLVIGARFGSTLSDDDTLALATKMDEADLEKLALSKLSITQAEALTAAINSIPVFAFVERDVDYDYRTYRRNADQDFVSDIQYASMSKAGTAEYIFNFIEYLKRRPINNSITVFDGIDDIYKHLQKQWSGLFQRLLYESRRKSEESARIDRLTDQLEELKKILLKSVATSGSKHIASLTVQFRDLVAFIHSLPRGASPTQDLAIASTDDWHRLLLSTAGVAALEPLGPEQSPWSTLLRRGALEPYVCSLSTASIGKLGQDWEKFRILSPDQRAAVFEGIVDVLRPSAGLLSPIPHDWKESHQTGVLFGQAHVGRDIFAIDSGTPEPPLGSGKVGEDE